MLQLLGAIGHVHLEQDPMDQRGQAHGVHPLRSGTELRLNPFAISLTHRVLSARIRITGGLRTDRGINQTSSTRCLASQVCILGAHL